MPTSASPYRSVQGEGDHLRPSATDLGRGSTTKEEDALIKALMGPRAKHKNRPKDGSSRLKVNV
tara:strand:+ start:679 stop:870 length:192 start_codon:yes stop_codon:yes gene_type:complete